MGIDTRYYFPKWNVLCTLESDGSYWVVNGAWGFTYKDGIRKFLHTDKVVSDDKDYPIEYTYEDFEKEYPYFGYW